MTLRQSVPVLSLQQNQRLRSHYDIYYHIKCNFTGANNSYHFGVS